jgi:hypothetical protein
MQMDGGRKVTLHPGQTFYEDPPGIHLVGQNASNKKPAKFLVFLIKDENAPIFVPVAKQTRWPKHRRSVFRFGLFIDGDGDATFFPA